MLVLTLVLAGVGFALLVVALTTGSVIWAWACIGVCIIGAVLLLVSAPGR
ncbi:polyferredoxin [Rhodococcus sp. 27YEA15]